MQVTVGSTALLQVGLNRRQPKDMDIWTDSCTDTDLVFGKGQDIVLMPTDIIRLVEQQGGYGTPDSIYTIKCSHLGWANPMWNKHKLDCIWLYSRGCRIQEELYQALVSHWKIKFGNKDFLNLNRDKEEFFTDDVVYRYDHDYLHELVSYPNRPMYESILKVGEAVLIDKEKFDDLLFDDQLRLFREEITVIAVERWLVHSGKYTWMQAYSMSLEKTITRLTKNWATDFIVRWLHLFIKQDYTYFEHILNTIERKK